MNSQINLSTPINIEAKQVLNLDTGTAIALIAENSPHRYELRQYVNGKEMVMTQTAFSEFIPIVKTIARLSEQTRANRLLQRVTIIPDNPSSRALNLKPTRNLGINDIIILGTGDQLGIVTTTADAKAVRAASAQGVDFHVYIHPPFPLTGN
jgi:predicted nucleic acid-binding protein